MSIAEPPAKHQQSRAQAIPAPLLLVPFERLMLIDDAPAYPMLFVFELKFSGQIDQPAFTNAWQQALQRHPLLTALVDHSKLSWHWSAETPLPPIDWADAEEPLTACFNQSIDLATTPGLKAWIRQGAQEARFVCQFHHACCDGYGALQFFEDLFVLYAQQVDEEATANFKLKPLEPERLAQRASFGLEPPSVKQQIIDTIFGAKEVWNFLRHKLQRLSVTSDAAKQKLLTGDADKTYTMQTPVPAGERRGYQELLLEKPILVGLRKAAAVSGVTVNDLLLRDLFLTLKAWNIRHDPQMSDRHIRVMMPCNLRLPADDQLPAANVIGYAFLKRMLSETKSNETLLKGLQEETKSIREYRLSLYFLGGLGTAFAVPSAISTLLAPKYCMATAYLTNIGDWSRFILPDAPRQQGKLVIGNLVLNDLAAIPPLRSNTRIGISVSIYAQQMKLGMKFDPHLFSKDDCQQFSQLFLEQLSASAEITQATQETCIA